MLKHDIDIRNFWNNTHQNGDVGMSQYRLHNNLVLDFLKKLICKSRIEDLFDSDRCAIQFSLVNNTETALGNFLTEFEVREVDFSYTGNWRKSTRGN
jgi:hypothetical protein